MYICTSINVSVSWSIDHKISSPELCTYIYIYRYRWNTVGKCERPELGWSSMVFPSWFSLFARVRDMLDSESLLEDGKWIICLLAVSHGFQLIMHSVSRNGSLTPPKSILQKAIRFLQMTESTVLERSLSVASKRIRRRGCKWKPYWCNRLVL